MIYITKIDSNNYASIDQVDSERIILCLIKIKYLSSNRK